ncbi:cytochrome oxidase assembly [Ferrimonas balearica DSM 9799]|uniref:Cytochrome oxidase assembly n=1 Tax=Ferrimonas balearica (strain DSM 9799 / CCM 4581 / KCTC 23876 / PAT) TaxID=550540 RepID=E1SL12_FERBD|nr:COX15/CtaA family protein [Ferrimonas balearica]ADN74406.1 cytochrome oxidase assembly [Ferrimonas balearica DSM 9799]MBY5982046.1 COX15/CtaA family protein [Ferrimonas balearica]
MKKLTFATLCLTFVVILLGAFTRLTDAGLGCPDWPGCYGFLTVPSAEHVEVAEARFPERPVEVAKAWAEMVHRYVAGTLGLFIFALALLSLKSNGPKGLPWLLVGLVLFQAALGMWTVTLNLLPVVVMGHLMGGFAIFSLLFLLWLRQSDNAIELSPLRVLATVALVVLLGQIMLGGWTSANYAALVCTQLPICEGDWMGNLAPLDAFHPLPPPAESYEFGVLDYPARMTIHVSHRIGAVITALVLLWLWWRLRQSGANRVAAVLGTVLLVQVALGVTNVVGSLPLPVAVAHNGVAALLLLTLVWINHLAWQRPAKEG